MNISTKTKMMKRTLMRRKPFNEKIQARWAQEQGKTTGPKPASPAMARYAMEAGRASRTVSD
jgi:hypothetical protein